MSERNKIYPVYYNTVFGILGIVFGVSLWLLSYNHTDLSIFNLDINGVIAITGIAYGFMNMAVRTICIWLTMWILSRNLYNGGVTINELALTSDFAHGRWYNIMKLTPKRTAIMICCEILLLITEIGYKFGVQSGDSYSVEYNITNGFSHNYYSAGLFRGAACDGENYVLCLTDTAINILTDGVATADLSTLENWGFLQTFIWQESNNVIYSILQRPYINSDTLNQVGPNLTDHNIVAKKLSGLVLSIVRIEVVNARNMNGWSSYGSVVVNCALDFDYTTWNDTISPIGDTIIIDGWSNCIPNHHHMEIRMELCNGTVEWTIEPGQQVQSWNVTNLSNLQCGPIGINTTKGSQVLSSMSAQGGLYGLDHRLFSLTLIDAADASQSGKSTLGVDVVGWNLSRIYVYQRIQVAVNALAYVQNSWPGTISQYIAVEGTAIKYLHSTIVYNTLNLTIASVMIIFIFVGVALLAMQTYKITWAGTIRSALYYYKWCDQHCTFMVYSLTVLLLISREVRVKFL